MRMNIAFLAMLGAAAVARGDDFVSADAGEPLAKDFSLQRAAAALDASALAWKNEQQPAIKTPGIIGLIEIHAAALLDQLK